MSRNVPTPRAIAPSFTVDDVRESIRWYTEVLGFQVDEPFEHDGELLGASLKWGEIVLVINQDDWKQGTDRKKGAGVRLYFTVDEVDDLAKAIEAAGGTLTAPPTDQPWGTRDFSLQDPTGYPMTFSTPWDES